MATNKSRGKNAADDDEKRKLKFKKSGQEYARVTRMLGNFRCEAMCIDGTKRVCHIGAKMSTKVWIAAGDIILVRLGDYQDNRADVIFRYTDDEARKLQRCHELPVSVHLNLTVAGGVVDKDADGYDSDDTDIDLAEF